MITGVSRGLGKVLALEMARRGHTVIGCARSKETLQSLRAEIADVTPAGIPPPRHFFIDADVVRSGFISSVSHSDFIIDILVYFRARILACGS